MKKKYWADPQYIGARGCVPAFIWTTIQYLLSFFPNLFSMNRKHIFTLLLGSLGLIALLGTGFLSPKPPVAPQEVNWVSIEEAADLAAQDGKKIMVDLYTDWCGWCKRMDATTYRDPAVVAYINEHYHAVKFDAEQKGDVTVGGQTFKFRADAGRRGAHELAINMLNGRMSYPSTVFFEHNLTLLYRLPGYQKADEMNMILNYLGEDAYKNTPWDKFSQAFKAQQGK